jgi:hypothetical protein
MAATIYAAKAGTLCNTPSGGTTAAGPYVAGSSFTDIGTLTSSVNLYGFVDGSNRAKYFYSTTAGSVALPTISSVPNALPNGAVPLGTAGASFIYAVLGLVGAAQQIGMLYFQVTPAAGSPDTGSPTQFSLDPYGLLITDSATLEWA